jgi:hypothetical protein
MVKVSIMQVELQDQGQICWYPQKGVVWRSTYVKYQSPSTKHSNITAKVKVLNNYINNQGQGHKVKKFGTHGKVLLQRTLMWNIKALVHTIKML